LDSFVTNDKKWCPQVGCVLAVQTLRKLEPVEQGVSCDCGADWCFLCTKDDHSPSSCEQAANWTLKNNSDSENVNWILANTKMCPKCKVQIEKNQGCNHMTCKNCKYEFCWLCKGDWVKHTACSKFTADGGRTGASEEEAKATAAKNELQRYMHYFTRFDNHAKSIKFAQKTLSTAEKRAEDLQKLKGAGAQAVQFLLDSTRAVIKCRRVLQWTYVYAFYLTSTNLKDKDLFETYQAQLDEFTEKLHGMAEQPIEKMTGNDTRTKMISYTHLVEKYRDNVVTCIGMAAESSLTSTLK